MHQIAIPPRAHRRPPRRNTALRPYYVSEGLQSSNPARRRALPQTCLGCGHLFSVCSCEVSRASHVLPSFFSMFEFPIAVPWSPQGLRKAHVCIIHTDVYADACVYHRPSPGGGPRAARRAARARAGRGPRSGEGTVGRNLAFSMVWGPHPAFAESSIYPHIQFSDSTIYHPRTLACRCSKQTPDAHWRTTVSLHM